MSQEILANPYPHTTRQSHERFDFIWTRGPDQEGTNYPCDPFFACELQSEKQNRRTTSEPDVELWKAAQKLYKFNTVSGSSPMDPSRLSSLVHLRRAISIRFHWEMMDRWSIQSE